MLGQSLHLVDHSLLYAWPPSLQAVQEVMGGDPVLHVVCTGQDGSAELAILCGPWAGLQLPEANVDVIVFGWPSQAWDGFSTQFQWSFDQLVALFYLWPWSPSDAGLQGGPQSMDAVATAIQPLLTMDAVATATYEALHKCRPSTALRKQVSEQNSSRQHQQTELLLCHSHHFCAAALRHVGHSRTPPTCADATPMHVGASPAEQARRSWTAWPLFGTPIWSCHPAGAPSFCVRPGKKRPPSVAGSSTYMMNQVHTGSCRHQAVPQLR